jgi:hypothetical protein
MQWKKVGADPISLPGENLKKELRTFLIGWRGKGDSSASPPFSPVSISVLMDAP